MSAIATVLAAMGHTVSGQRPEGDHGRSSSRCRARASSVAVGHEPSHAAATVDAVAVSTAIAGRRPRGRGGPGAGASRCCAGPRSWPPSAPSGARSRWPAPTARPRPRRCWPWSSSRPGCEPSFIVGGDVNELGSGAAWDGDGRSWSRPTRATARSSSSAPRSPSSPTSSPTTSSTTAASTPCRTASSASSPALDGPAVVCVDDPGAAAWWPPPPEPVTYGTGRGRRLPHRRRRGVGGRRPLHARDRHRTGAPSRRASSCLPVPGVHNARNAAGAAGAGPPARASPWPRRAAALARFAGVARRFEYRGEAAGVTFVDDYAHLPTEVAAALAAAADAAAGAGSCACSSPTATAAPRRSGASSPTPSSTPTCWSSPTSTPAGEAPRPGVTGQAASSTPCSTPTRGPRSPTSRSATTWCRGCGPTLRPGDLCLTLGRRRPHLAADEHPGDARGRGR